jgi:ABC-type multidrug transport system fused ATPase/permease subunit
MSADLAVSKNPADASIWPAVRFVVSGRYLALAKMAATAFVGGLAEAIFLVTVTRVGLAITAGDDRLPIVGGREVTIDAALLVALGLVALRIVLAVYASWQSSYLASSAVADLRLRLSAAFLGASWEVQQAQRSGSLQELLTSFTGQSSTLMSGVSQGVLSFANLIALLGIAVAVDPVGALVLVASVGVLGSLLRPLRGAVRRRSKDAARAGMAFATGVSEIADLGMELHVFHVQAAARSRVGHFIEQSRVKSQRLHFVTGIATPVYSGIGYLAVLGALAAVTLSETTSLTSLGASMLVMLRSLSYGQALQSSLTSVTSSSAPLQELQEELQRLEHEQRADGGVGIDRAGSIALDRVSFSYGSAPLVLKDLSFRIEAREVVGIVGPSGGGKSTLVQLMLGLRDPVEGVVLVDDRPLDSFDRSELARRITFVPQAPRLIAGTVEENIRFFRSPVSLDEVQQAARLAHLHDDIVGFPEGYDRQVGEHGGHLSGGQQQRLCIARALVEDPDVLIMDEPTSSLDVRSENLIRSTLLELKERMTVVIIAHRLSTLDICDRIMVIQDGELKAFDTPAELERSSEFYREALVLSGMR